MQEDNTMGMRVNAELPLPADLKNEYPLSDKLKAIKAKRDEEIRDIFTGKSDKFVVIIGPCSADKNLHEQATYNRRGIQGNVASAGSGAGTGSACRNHCNP